METLKSFPIKQATSFSLFSPIYKKNLFSFRFPLYHTGALFGLSLLLSAVVTLFQIPMFALMEGPYDGDPTWVGNLLFIFLKVNFISSAN